jgi:hypothetical protein
VRTDEVEEKDKHGNEVVGGIKRAKPLFGFVPGLELLVEGFDQVVRATPLKDAGGVVW